MMRRLMKSWDKLARDDAYWAVLTADDKRGQGWEPDAFFATGEADVVAVFATIEKLGLTINRTHALDFGCGVGRLSRALASRFKAVDGIDISRVMVERATSLVSLENVRFLHNPALDLSQLGARLYTFILSLISLQHMPEKMAAGYISEMCRILAPGGIGYLQVSTFLSVRDSASLEKLSRDESPLNQAYRALRSVFFRPIRMDTHYCRLSRILRILERKRMRLVAVLPDASLPAPFVSHILVFENPM